MRVLFFLVWGVSALPIISLGAIFPSCELVAIPGVGGFPAVTQAHKVSHFMLRIRAGQYAALSALKKQRLSPSQKAKPDHHPGLGFWSRRPDLSQTNLESCRGCDTIKVSLATKYTKAYHVPRARILEHCAMAPSKRILHL